MFRVLEVGAAGPPATSVGEQGVGPPPPGLLRWIDLQAQGAAQLELLARRFGFHPLTIEDCSHFDQRPKLEEYGDYSFIVTHGLELSGSEDEDLRLLELHAFLGDRYLVTVHTEPIEPLETVWKRVSGDGAIARRGTDFISYLIADAIVDTLFPMVDRLAGEVEELEETVLDRVPSADVLPSILRLKRLLVTLRKVLSPQRDVLAMLAKPGHERIAERTAIYFRDVYDHLLRTGESVEVARDLLGNVLDAYLWGASQRTNEIMKRLTILSAIFLPLTFITGFFGQNFTTLPFDSKLLLGAMLASCAIVPAGMLYFFLRSKWF